MAVERETLQRRIGELAQVEGDVRIIRLQQVHELAAAFDCPIREVELAALEIDVVPWRYLRNLGTVGLEGQARLLRATVAVVGLGGGAPLGGARGGCGGGGGGGGGTSRRRWPAWGWDGWSS